MTETHSYKLCVIRIFVLAGVSSQSDLVQETPTVVKKVQVRYEQNPFLQNACSRQRLHIDR